MRLWKRKKCQKFNSEAVIQNIWELGGEAAFVDEIPYWETVNKYLEKLEPEELQDIVCRLVYRLVRSRAFADARIRDKYWQIIVDGTQLNSSRRKLDEKSLHRIHNKGTDREYYFWYQAAELQNSEVLWYNKCRLYIRKEFWHNEELKLYCSFVNV